MQLCAQTHQLQKQDGIMTDSNLGTQKESEINISNIGQQKINTLMYFRRCRCSRTQFNKVPMQGTGKMHLLYCNGDLLYWDPFRYTLLLLG